MICSRGSARSSRRRWAGGTDISPRRWQRPGIVARMGSPGECRRRRGWFKIEIGRLDDHPERELEVAEIVGALGVPHTPYYPALVEREGPECETARLFAAVTKELEAMRPDLIVMYDTDHLNTFFLDNLPVFAIGVTGEFRGPNDEPRSVPVYHHQIPSRRCRPSAAPLHRSRFRHCPGAGIHGRSFGRGAAALHQSGHARAGDSDLHRRARSAAAVGAALLRARRHGQARDRELARAAARGRHRQRKLLAGSVRPAHRARESRMACRSPNGPGGSAR